MELLVQQVEQIMYVLVQLVTVEQLAIYVIKNILSIFNLSNNILTSRLFRIKYNYFINIGK